MLSCNLSEWYLGYKIQQPRQNWPEKKKFLIATKMVKSLDDDSVIFVSLVPRFLMFSFLCSFHRSTNLLLSTPVSSQRESFCDLHSALLFFHTFNCQDHHDTAQPCPRAVKWLSASTVMSMSRSLWLTSWRWRFPWTTRVVRWAWTWQEGVLHP